MADDIKITICFFRPEGIDLTLQWDREVVPKRR